MVSQSRLLGPSKKPKKPVRCILSIEVPETRAGIEDLKSRTY